MSFSAAFVVAAVAAAAACGGEAGPGARSGGPRGKVTVFAAASLQDAFREIAASFEQRYAGVEIEFNFGGSPTLRTQLEQGARADVFASANAEQMELARAGGVVEAESRTFARNALVIITPASDPGRVTAPADLRRPGLKLVLAQPDVPAGSYARRSLAAMAADAAFGPRFEEAVLANLVSLESNVKQIVAKVELGEADAGIVYATDVTASVAPHVRRVEIPERFNVVAEYPIALVKGRRNDAGARAFIAFVLSADGQAVLARHGFLAAG